MSMLFAAISSILLIVDLIAQNSYINDNKTANSAAYFTDSTNQLYPLLWRVYRFDELIKIQNNMCNNNWNHHQIWNNRRRIRAISFYFLVLLYTRYEGLNIQIALLNIFDF